MAARQHACVLDQHLSEAALFRDITPLGSGWDAPHSKESESRSNAQAVLSNFRFWPTKQAAAPQLAAATKATEASFVTIGEHHPEPRRAQRTAGVMRWNRQHQVALIALCLLVAARAIVVEQHGAVSACCWCAGCAGLRRRARTLALPALIAGPASYPAHKCQTLTRDYFKHASTAPGAVSGACALGQRCGLAIGLNYPPADANGPHSRKPPRPAPHRLAV